MKILTFVSVLLISAGTLFASDMEAVILPHEVTREMHLSPDDSIIKGKVWNRWTTENFVVCSLSNTQAKYLHDNLEDVKRWIFQRWGMYDIPFKAECKLICVDDKELFHKLFRLERTVVEVRRDTNGEIRETVIFLLLDDAPSKTVPMPLTEVCIAEFESEYNVRFGWWAHRGMAVLNGTVPNIRRNIADQMRTVTNNEPLFFSKSLMNTTEDDYNDFDAEKKRLFDRTAMLFCLMLKKEFGTTKYQEIMRDSSKGKNPESALQKVLGFKGHREFDASFKRYMRDLFEDVMSNKTPDSYLKVEPK